jgi:hypothetical protein
MPWAATDSASLAFLWKLAPYSEVAIVDPSWEQLYPVFQVSDYLKKLFKLDLTTT